MEVWGHLWGTPRCGKSKTEVLRCYTKIHEEDRSTERRSTRPKNVDNETSLRRLQIGKMAEEEERMLISY